MTEPSKSAVAAVIGFVAAIGEVRDRFFAEYPDIDDIGDLMAAVRSHRTMPRVGRSPGGISYSVHGAGCLFTDDAGRAVDLDRVRDTERGVVVEAFDAWRVWLFADSLGANPPATTPPTTTPPTTTPPSTAELAEACRQLADEGRIRAVPTTYDGWFARLGSTVQPGQSGPEGV